MSQWEEQVERVWELKTKDGLSFLDACQRVGVEPAEMPAMAEHVARLDHELHAIPAAAREEWKVEGVLENMLGLGIDLAYYIEPGHGVTHFVLAAPDADGMPPQVRGERRFFWGQSMDDRRVLEGVRREWALAKEARAHKDERAAFVFTYRGLRLLFPHLLPEEP